MGKDKADLVAVNKYSKITLYVLEGYLGLPSVDPLSSQLIYSLKLHDLKRIEVKTCRFSVSAKLPRLEIDNNVITHPVLIRKQIDAMTGNEIDTKYPAMDVSRIMAYKTVVGKFLELYALLNGWGTEENTLNSTKLYSKGIYFPFRFFYVRNLRNKMWYEVEDACNNQEKSEVIEHAFSEAATYLKDFTNTLGVKKFMFGKHPTSLDVYLCSYLAPALYFDYPDNKLNQLIAECDSTFAEYIHRFVDAYGTGKDSRKLGKDKERDRERDNDRAPMTVIFAAGFCAVTAMIGFAFVNGLIKN